MSKTIETFCGIVFPALCDPQWHMNIQHYVGFFDQAEWHTYLKLGFEARHMHEDQIGWADVRQVIEYKRELKAGDYARIESVLTRAGTKSITTWHVMYDASTAEVCATLEAVTAQYDLKTRQAIPIIEPVRRNLADWLVEPAPAP